ncbi:hypothetical protein [Pseudonocardia lacus]|nr:hypothetical protein [Pseudonocardia lacus]
MSTLDVVGLALVGAGILAGAVGVAVWAERDARRRERARLDRHRTH